MANMLAAPKGSTLFRPGEDCPGFVVVHAGRIKVSMLAENGREIVLYRVGPGDICLQTFGCLVKKQSYSAEGVAETDLSFEIVPDGEFHQRVASDEGFRQRLFAAVAARFSDMEQLIEDVALSPFEARLARTLLRLADAEGRLAATHEAIALEMGSGRAAVTRGVGAFARKGLVANERGEIRVLDRAGLEHLTHDAG